MSMPSTGIRFQGTCFWVRHRHREYGPFDYEWSRDFAGVEFLYQRQKFGEYCSPLEIDADLREFRLPMRVVEVGSIVCGSLIYGIINGLSFAEKRDVVTKELANRGLERFADNIHGWQ